MFRSRSVVLAVLALALAAGVHEVEAQQTVTVSGTVSDESGAPIAGAAVLFEGPVQTRSITDRAGGYRVDSLQPGTYQVQVEALGYRSIPRELRANQGSINLPLVVQRSAVEIAPLQVISTARSGTGTSAASLPIKVQIIEPVEISQQQSLATNPAELLTNLIPSFAPGRQKLTSSGESFRGRRPLFLVDGVPQSNPLRDGQREGFTIDMEALERVEVVFGANAIQGLGATGGIVNFVTRRPTAGSGPEHRISLTTTTNDGFDGDGSGWRGSYLFADRFGSIDVLGTASYERRGLQYDGENRTIGLDNVQGDIADSWSRNFLAKIGWEPAAGQRLQLMVNDFRLEQRGAYDVIIGNRSEGIPVVSVKGSPEGVEPINDVTTASLDYEHSHIGGGTLSAKAYFQDFSALYGGGRFASFQDPTIAPVGEIFDQSENNSTKYGTRLTWARSRIADAPLDVVTGFDFLRDKTLQRLVNTNRNWVPVTKFINYAPFLQVDVRPLPWVSVSSGIRWEIAELDVPDFTPLAANRADFEPVQVAGGKPSFDEPLLNVGAVITPISALRLYGTVSQAYTMPDVGRVLRGISEHGTSVEQFLNLTPIKTDNIEAGAAVASAWGRLGATWFVSTAELGSRLVANADGFFEVVREPTETSGWEFTGRLVPTDLITLDAGYSLLNGQFDGNGDGEVESDLGAADIGPNRLNLSADIGGRGRLSGRIQAFHYFDRTFRNGNGDVTAEFDGYSTVDVSSAFAFGRSTVTLSVANILDEQYITYFSQAGTNLNDRYFSGRGRTLTLRLETRL